MGKKYSSPEMEILFEDDHLIALVKPAGLITANAPAGKPSLFTWLQERLGTRPGKRLGGTAFVGIVSRLDAAVSGVVVAAKTPAAAANLAEQFRQRSVRKTYAAVVAGRFPAPLGAWVEWSDQILRGEGSQPSLILPQAVADAPQPVSRFAAPRGSQGPSRESPQDARTRARVVRRAVEVSLVALEPITGRRHQLRAQLAARGCPIVGDRLYGSRLPFPLPGGIALHAEQLEVAHPFDGRPLVFESPCRRAWSGSFQTIFPPPGRA